MIQHTDTFTKQMANDMIQAWLKSDCYNKAFGMPKFSKKMKAWFLDEVGVEVMVRDNLPRPYRIVDLELYTIFKLST